MEAYLDALFGLFAVSCACCVVAGAAIWPSRALLGGEGSRRHVRRVVAGAGVWPLIYLIVLKRSGRSMSR